jgi:hypothetical protein
MKTAVEWFNEEIKELFNQYQNEKISESMLHFNRLLALNQAKEMEKKQRQEDTNYGYSQGWDDGNQNNEPMKPEIKDLKTKV